MNDFTKLDQFIREHKPQADLLSTIPSQNKSRLFWIPLGITSLALSFIFLTKQLSEPLYMESLFVAESIEWEIEEDGAEEYYDLI